MNNSGPAIAYEQSYARYTKMSDSVFGCRR
jgi:hypothetical protein